MVRGNFDDCLRLARGAGRGLPGRAGQLGQPGPARGPEDRGLRDRRLPRRRPRRPPAAGRQRRQHRGVLDGLPRVRRRSAAPRKPPRMWGFQAEGAAPLVTGEPFADPETVATAIRIGNPASWKLAEAARDESGGRFEAVTDDADPRTRSASSPPATASSSSRRRPPASPGCSQRRRSRRRRTPARRSSVTVTGHGLKDIATALEGVGRPRRHRRRRRRRRGRRGRRARPDRGTVRRRPGAGLGAGDLAPTSGPGFDALGLALDLRDELDGRGDRRRARGRGRRARARTTCRATSRTWWSARCARPSTRWACQPPGLRLTCRNAIPHGRGLGSSAAAIVGRRRAGPRRWSPAARCWSTTTRCSRWPPRSRAIPTTSRRRCSAASRSPGRSDDGGSAPCRLDVDPRRRRGRVRAADAGLDRASRAACCPTTVPHADAAANAGRAALLVAALAGRPELLLAATEDWLHQDYREPAMPESLGAGRRAARRRARRGLSRAPGPTVLAFTDGADADRRRWPRWPRDGWPALAARRRRPRGSTPRRLTRRMPRSRPGGTLAIAPRSSVLRAAAHVGRIDAPTPRSRCAASLVHASLPRRPDRRPRAAVEEARTETPPAVAGRIGTDTWEGPHVTDTIEATTAADADGAPRQAPRKKRGRPQLACCSPS